jgi:hypothetical protein
VPNVVFGTIDPHSTIWQTWNILYKMPFFFASALLLCSSTWRRHVTNWWYGVFSTHHSWNLMGQLPLFLSNLLEAYYFHVQHGNVLSVQYTQENGVPEGSVLSVTLIEVTINGMVNTVEPSVVILLYVDNISICYSTRSIVTIKHQLQGAVNCLGGLWRKDFFSPQIKPSVRTPHA